MATPKRRKRRLCLSVSFLRPKMKSISLWLAWAVAKALSGGNRG